jgi:hypothetical protein
MDKTFGVGESIGPVGDIVVTALFCSFWMVGQAEGEGITREGYRFLLERRLEVVSTTNLLTDAEHFRGTSSDSSSVTSYRSFHSRTMLEVLLLLQSELVEEYVASDIVDDTRRCCIGLGVGRSSYWDGGDDSIAALI